MRLDREPVFGAERMEAERRQRRHRRGAARLVAPHLEPVAVGAEVVGVVDHPGGEPQHLALERLQDLQTVGASESGRAAARDGHGGECSRERNGCQAGVAKRGKRKSPRSMRELPSRTSSESASPSAAECLKPWPEQAEAMITREKSGWRSITKP